MDSGPCGQGGDPRFVGDPVDTLTGAAVERKLEFRLVGPIELRWYRHYDSSQAQRSFVLGHGHTHEFDRRLQRTPEGLVYEAPIGRTQAFPALEQDGEQAVRQGFVLRRLHAGCYRLYRRGEPAMEFAFADAASGTAPLARLVDGAHAVAFHHDAAGRPCGIVDALGRRISISTDEQGRITSLVLEDTATGQPALLQAYQYDERGDLVRTANATGHGDTLLYDDAHRLLKRTGRKGFSFHFAYDDAGRCIRAVGDERLHGVALSYEVPGRLTRVTRADLGTWAYRFSPAGLLAEIRDPQGGVQRFLPDEQGRPGVELDANGNPTRLAYDAAGALAGKVDPRGHRVRVPDDPNVAPPLTERVAAHPLEYELGASFAARSITLPDAFWIQGLEGLTSKARALIVAAPHPDAATSRALRGSGFTVAPLGPLWWPEPERGRVFNVLGKLVAQHDEWSRTRQWSYDASGNVEGHVDFDGSAWRYDNGAWHFLRGITDPLGHEVRMDYTSSGYLARCVDAGGTVTDYRYDFCDRLTEVWRQGELRDRYVRDASGNLVAKHARDGRELLRIEIGPNNLRRRRVLASGGEHEFAYDPAGRPVKAQTKKDTVELAYDPLGRRVLDQRNGFAIARRPHGPAGGGEDRVFGRFLIRRRWNEAGDELTITDPGGLCHSIRHLGHGVILRRLGNGSRETAQYDNRGRCHFKCTELDGAARWTRQYRWSGENELLQVHDEQHGDVQHEYDRAHRLVRRLSAGRVESFAMDPAGNLVAQPGLEAVALHSGNRLLGAAGAAFSYNDRDHLDTRTGDAGLTRYAYDSRDLLVEAHLPTGTWRADYDAFGRRTRKQWQGRTTEFHWCGDQLIAERHDDGRVRIYVYADTMALTPVLYLDYDSLDADPASARRGYVFSDQLGTPCRIEDDAARVVWSALVEPYGRLHLTAGAATDFALRLPGHYADPELGLHCNRHRYYDPGLGRYIQSDPWGLAGGFNVHAYRANPLFEADPRGLGEEGDTPRRPPDDDEEGTPRRQSIAEREAEGGNPPQRARDNPHLYEYDTQTGQYRRIEGEGHSRSSEFPSGYRQSTHDEMAARHTDEGEALGYQTPRDANGRPIPHDQLTWRDSQGREIDYYAPNGSTNLTYDHQTSCVDMYNNGATTTDPNTGATTTYPPGRDTNRDTRNDFYNDPNNLQPMSRPDNSGKGGGTAPGGTERQTYNDQPTGPNYEP